MNKLEQAHKLSRNNNKLIQNSRNAGCFYCLKIYPPSDIKDWLPVDAKTRAFNKKGHTAICPKCHIDSVLPGTTDYYELTQSFLEEMYQYWFNQKITIRRNGKLVEENLMNI